MLEKWVNFMYFIIEKGIPIWMGAAFCIEKMQENWW